MLLGKMAMRILLTVGMLLALAQTADAHGGGCRKDSPPGQCCHMDRKAGISHCH